VPIALVVKVFELDDHIRCRLNGKLVVSLDFGDPTAIVEIGPEQLRSGVNRLVCTVTDDDGGNCFAYNYQVWASLDGQPSELAHSAGAGCCGQQSCLRPSSVVLKETIWINNP